MIVTIRGHIMQKSPIKRLLSIFIVISMFFSTVFVGFLPGISHVKAAPSLVLDAGNITLELSETGRFFDIDVDLGVSTFEPLRDFQDYFFLYQDDYPVGEVANFNLSNSDFTYIDGTDIPLDWEETGTTQKIYGTFTETRITTPDDVRIHQTAWTKQGAFWVIIEWKIENIYGSDLTGIRAGMRLGSNFNSDRTDDRDFWDTINSTYYYNDADTPDKYFGFCSANTSDQLDHYYGVDFIDLPFINNDNDIYTALSQPNQTHYPTLYPPGANGIGTILDWNISSIPAGERRTISLVLAFGSDLNGLQENISNAQAFYAVASLPRPDLIITEIMDSGVDEFIEVYNKGDGTANVADINISVDGGATNLSIGSWNASSIPVGGYGIFTTGSNVINDEGDTVSVFYTLDDKLEDAISYGQEGYPPDPPPNQSVARIHSGTMYTNDWNWDSSPTFGDGIGPVWSDEQNDVAGIVTNPLTRLNEVLFNPSAETMFIEIISFLDPGNLNGTKIVCDSVYTLGDYLVIDQGQKNFYTLYEDSFPAGFDVTSSGDNIYLFDKDGQLLDMVGWNSSHNPDMSVRRNFDGIGKFDGWNDATTELAQWSFNQIPDPYFELLITEVQDSPFGSEAIELYYRGEENAVFDISNWRLTYNGVDITIPPGTTVPGGGYLVFGDHPFAALPLGLSLDDEGGNISLFLPNGSLYRYIGYGTNGTTPDPLLGESSARYAKIYIDNLYIYEDGWNREQTPTISSENDVLPVSPDPHLKLNEVLYNPNLGVGFIELIYDGNYVTYKIDYNKTYAFINASQGGVPLSFADEDDGYKGVWMDFTFNYYGKDYSLIQIGVNGYIGFASYPTRPDNLDFPLSDDDMQVVMAPMWDDLNLSASAGGGIYYKTTGSSPNRIFTITYYKIEHKTGPNYDYDGKYMTFEVNLYESDYRIVFQYEDLQPGSINLSNIDDPSNHTIGLNNGDGVRSVQYTTINDTDDGLDLEFTHMYDMDITGYKIVCDDEYTIGEGGSVMVAPIDPYTTLIESYYPGNFDMDVDADNVYLYDNLGRLLDMVGWSTPHSQDKSMNRWPEGFGPPTGYDDESSINAGWVFNVDPTMEYKPPFFTEVRDSNLEQVEIYNPSVSGVNLSLGKGWYLETDSGGPWNLSSYGIISSGGYVNITLPDGSLNDEGDEVRLYDEADILWSRMRYGTKGLVPDPLYSESAARYFEGVYSENWSHDPTPTFEGGNEQNDVSAHNETPMVLLNEVMFNPDFIEYSFVEAKLIVPGSLDISGYKIICDDVYIVPPGTVLNDIDPYFNLLYDDAPYFFQNVTPTGDNIYLYTDNDNLIDMVGWTSTHQQNKTVARVPEGAGLFRAGYDDSSSVLAGWVFNQTPTVPLILVGPDITGYGFPGENITYNLTLKNKHNETEIIDISNLSAPNGWIVITLDENKNPLPDSNLNGRPDVTLDPDETVNITVIIFIPNIFPMADLEITTITIQGYYNPIFGDKAILESRLYPHLQLTKSASPTLVNLNGTGYNEVFTITLNATGSGYGQQEQLPQDVIFIVDRSGSMSMQDINLAKEALLNYTYDMSIPDTGAVVHFDDNVVLMSNLTAKYDDLRDDISNIPGSGGLTYMGSAMHAATMELLNNGQDGHIWVEILLSDGEPSTGEPYDPLNEADYAASNSIIIYTVGLGMTPNSTQEVLLEEIANRTGGEYFRAETAEDLNDIYTVISGYVKEIAAIDINTNDSVPMIMDVLPPWINLVNDSFNIPPDHINIDAFGNTIIEWNKTIINIGESFELTFNCTSSKWGSLVLTNVIDSSRANYTRWDNKTTEVLFPPCYVNVIGGVAPPQLYLETAGVGADDLLLQWDHSPSPGVAKYLIYRSETRDGFDFSSPWIDTSSNSDGGIIALRSTWNITGVDATDYDELYFTMRAADSGGNMSINTRTVGKYSRTFEAGISAFSLPLKPIDTLTADDLILDMGSSTNYIKWMDTTSHIWRAHNYGDGAAGPNNVNLSLGRGYEVEFSVQTYVTFVGMPGTMIKYIDPGYAGFDPLITAQSLTATIVGNSIRLDWTRPAGVIDGDFYLVYYSTTRDGFFGGLGTDYWEVPGGPIVILGASGTVTHTDALLNYDRLYYMVVTFNTSAFGTSTYSIGVWTENYLSDYDTLGLPLKIYGGDKTVDWYCDNIQNTMGINYIIYSEQRWGWHRTNMLTGIYDVLIETAEGYQISTIGSTKYTFIGY